MFTIHNADSLDLLKTLPENSVHAVVTDPPYGLGDTSPARVADCMLAWSQGLTWTPKGSGFMSKAWDAWVPPPELWREVLRVLKPGGHALVFAGSRTQDLMSLSLRLAGFEVRDTLQWLYGGSAMPKSLNIAKNMDWVQAPADLSKVYEVTAWIREARDAAGIKNKDIDAATNTQMAGHWTSTKSQPAIPALHQVSALLNVLKLTPEQVPEHIVDVLLGERERAKGERVSLREVLGTEMKQRIDTHWEGERTLAPHTIYGAPVRTEAQQWEGWGTALKPAYEPVIMGRKPLNGTVVQNTLEHGCGGINVDGCRVGDEPRANGSWRNSSQDPVFPERKNGSPKFTTACIGRWPANVILDPEAGALLNAQAGEPVSRFFYCPKASRAEREAGLQGHATKTAEELTGYKEGAKGLVMTNFETGAPKANPYAGTSGAQPRANIHPTVKPINLMRYLVRLVTPSHGTVLDPFTGSGSTGCAAVLERVNFIGIERENEYARIATARINYWATQADAPQADTAQADQPHADTPQADQPQADTPQVPPTVHKTTRGARRKAPAEDDPQGSLF